MSDKNCFNCKHGNCSVFEMPCYKCVEESAHNCKPHYLWEPKETVVHKDISMNFGPYILREEQFKINDDIFKLDEIKKKLDEFSEALDSINSKLDILDQRMHDFRQHQILKDMKCVTQVKPTKQNPFKIPEPKFNIGDIVVYKGYNTEYKITDRGYNLSQKIWTYDFERSDNDKIIRSSREDRIELAKHEEKKPILPHEKKEYIYTHEEKLNPDEYAKFKVGDKVKLKHGKVIYTVKKIHASKHIPSERIFIRYTLGREGRKTDQSEYENRLTKA